MVADVVPGGADKDGRLKKKDRVVGVGQGNDGEIVDVVDMNLNEVVKLIRGKRGTTVRLKVIPVGETCAEGLRHRPGEDRTQRRRGPRRGDRGRSARPTVRLDKIGVINLPSFYMDMAGPGKARPSTRAAPATASGCSTTSSSRPSIVWCWTCGTTAAARCRRRSPHWPVHRHRPGGADQGCRQAGAAVSTTSSRARPGTARSWCSPTSSVPAPVRSWPEPSRTTAAAS